jgi:hypothetical protein
MTTAQAFLRCSESTATPTISVNRPPQYNWTRTSLLLAVALVLPGCVATPLTASAQNLGTTPQLGKAVLGQQATTVEGTVLNVVNWGCNVIAPVIAIARNSVTNGILPRHPTHPTVIAP